ncbi:MAG: hypothetical protein H6734_06265 [Alphaproteobacteria bacterium]|nr:hypothetical protein [Alphaproteobacteria bacterium]
MRIVVDASVARAAGVGRPDAGHPGPAAVAALEAVRDGGHQVVMSAAVREEWLRHQRPFAVRWLHQMVGTKRVTSVATEWPGVVDVLDAASVLPGAQPVEIAKDTHLVGLAMVTDRRVVSLDVRQRTLLRDLVPEVPSLAGLYWVSPTEETTGPWLLRGAPEEPALTLGHGA